MQANLANVIMMIMVNGHVEDDDDGRSRDGNVTMIKEPWDEVDTRNNGMEARKK